MNFTIEQKAIHHLLLYSNTIRDIGLFEGKTGLAIFFAHYFKVSANPVYDDTADDLIDEVADAISMRHPIGFASGLSGIGWGIEYLIQKGFMNGNSLEVCEEIDREIMEKDPRRITDHSIETGLGGILHYVLAHIKGVYNQTGKLPFDQIYMGDLYHAAKRLCENKESTDEAVRAAKLFVDFYTTKKIPDYKLDIHWFKNRETINDENLYTSPIGLKSGLAGGIFDLLIPLNTSCKS